MEHDYSLADIRAATGSDDMFGGNSAWWILILFFLCGGNGFGWGNRGVGEAVATNADLQRGFDTQAIISKLDGLSNGLCDGFYAMNTGMLNGFNGVTGAVKEAQFAAQQCCCETNRNIDALRFDGQKNTCEITSAIHAEGEQTRALINANTMQALRDKLADRDRDLLTANFQLSQQAQNATLISELRPCARPAYLTCSPYDSMDRGCGRFNCG